MSTGDEVTPDPCGRGVDRLEWAVLGAWLAAAIAAAACGRQLWADGAYFFDKVVAHGITGLPDLGRQHARFVAEWPAALLLAAGVRDGSTLSVVFGLEHLLLVPSGLLGFLLIAPRDAWRARLGAFVAAGLGLVGSMFAMSEALVLVAVALPLVAVLYLRPRRPWLLLLAALLHLVAVRTYEVYPVLALVVLHAWARQRRAGPSSRACRALWAVQLVLVACGLAVTTASFLVGGRDSTNTVRTLQTLLDGADYGPVYALAASAVVAYSAPLLPPRWRRWSFGVLCLAAATFAVVPWVAPAMVIPRRAYLTRAAGTAIGIALLGASCALPGRSPVGERAGPPRWRAAAGPLLLLCVLSWDVASTVQWAAFRRAFQEEIARYEGCGVVPAEAWRPVTRRRPFRRFLWSWTTPYLVGALAPEGPITAVLQEPGVAPLWADGSPPDLSRIGKSWALEGAGCAGTPP